MENRFCNFLIEKIEQNDDYNLGNNLDISCKRKRD